MKKCMCERGRTEYAGLSCPLGPAREKGDQAVCKEYPATLPEVAVLILILNIIQELTKNKKNKKL